MICECADYSVLTSTFLPLKATPNLKIFLTPLAAISVSYFLSTICCSAVCANAFRSSPEQSFAAFGSIRIWEMCQILRAPHKISYRETTPGIDSMEGNYGHLFKPGNTDL